MMAYRLIDAASFTQANYQIGWPIVIGTSEYSVTLSVTGSLSDEGVHVPRCLCAFGNSCMRLARPLKPPGI